MSNRIENFTIVVAGPGAFCRFSNRPSLDLTSKDKQRYWVQAAVGKPVWTPQTASNLDVNTSQLVECAECKETGHLQVNYEYGDHNRF